MEQNGSIFFFPQQSAQWLLAWGTGSEARWWGSPLRWRLKRGWQQLRQTEAGSPWPLGAQERAPKLHHLYPIGTPWVTETGWSLGLSETRHGRGQVSGFAQGRSRALGRDDRILEDKKLECVRPWERAIKGLVPNRERSRQSRARGCVP